MQSRCIKEEEFIPLNFDMIFKRVFGDPNDVEPLRMLIKVVLEIEAEEITILNSEILGERMNSKKTTVDLIVKLKDGIRIGMEMNRTASDSVMLRNFSYITKIMNSSLRHNEKYDQLDRFIQVNFDMDGTHLEPIDLYMVANVKNSDYLLTDKLRIYRVDVPFFTKRCYNLSVDELDYKDRFLGLIGINNSKLASSIVSGDPIMKDIKNKIEECNKDTEVIEEYDYRKYHDEISRLALKEEMERNMKDSYEEGLKEGIEEGIEQNNFQIVKKLLEENMDTEFISKVTGLTVEEINEINKK